MASMDGVWDVIPGTGVLAILATGPSSWAQAEIKKSATTSSTFRNSSSQRPEAARYLANSARSGLAALVKLRWLSQLKPLSLALSPMGRGDLHKHLPEGE